MKPLAEGSDDYELLDWNVVEGDWKYVSQFTGKTYDTSVRTCRLLRNGSLVEDMLIIEISNDIFGKAYIAENLYCGIVNFIDPISNEQPFPEVKGCSIDGQQVYAYTVSVPVNRAPVNFFQFLSSGMLQLPMMYFVYDENRNTEPKFTSLYDYLYDASVDAAKISANFPKVSHGGSLRVDLTKSASVDEVYYAVILDPRDESKINGEGIENFDPKEYGWAYSFKNIAPVIKDYAENGTLNPNLLLGKVEAGASSFDVPLTWEGIKAMTIVAYKDGEICDMVYDFIENRTEDGWQSVGYVDFKFESRWVSASISPGITNVTPDDYVYNGKIELQYRPSTKQYRYVAPYNVGNDRDYIYVNTSYGEDRAYVEASYTPYEITYSYTDRNGNIVNKLQSQIMFDLNSAKVIMLGHDTENVLKHFGLKFSTEYFAPSTRTILYTVPLSTICMCTHSRVLYDNGGSSVVFSSIAEDYAGVIIKDYILYFNLGQKVKSVKYWFVYKDGQNASKSYRYAPGDQSPSLTDYYASGEWTEDMTKLCCTACDAAGNAVKTIEVDLPDYPKSCEVTVSFDDAYPTTSGPRTAYIYNGYDNRIYNGYDNSLVIEIVDFSQGFYPGNLTIKIYKEDQWININRLYQGKETFSGLGECDVYVANGYDYSVGESPYIEGNTIVVPALLWVIYSDSGTYLWLKRQLEIELPQEVMDMLSGVEEVVVDESAEATESPVYYNLQGVRIQYPAKGAIVIERRGNTVRKIRY